MFPWNPTAIGRPRVPSPGSRRTGLRQARASAPRRPSVRWCRPRGHEVNSCATRPDEPDCRQQRRSVQHHVQRETLTRRRAPRPGPPRPGDATRRDAGAAGVRVPRLQTHSPVARRDQPLRRRLEFWDARLETAWVCEPTTSYHEHPSQTLAALVDRIAGVRGSPIKCYGTMDLLVRDAHGKPRRILQADQVVYLHPARANVLGSAVMAVGENHFPDVVLEVDHTTDVRPSKLGLYESWGFPELWVEVPDRRTSSRARGRRPGMTIHVLEDGAYRVADESRAFPGWTAAEVHAALKRVGGISADARGSGACGRGVGSAGGGPGRTMTRCSVRSGGRGSSKVMYVAGRKAGHGWPARYCCCEESRSRPDSSQAGPRLPTGPRMRSWRPRSPARARRTFLPVSSGPSLTDITGARQAGPEIAPSKQPRRC